MLREDTQEGPPPSSGLRPDVIVARRYRLVRKLADGGMGTVWVAHHTRLDCELALKFIHPMFAAFPDALERFEREAKAAALLATETEFVVRIFDYGVDDGVPFIAMELLAGEDLSARLGRRRLTPPEAATIGAQIGRALRKAHGRGIVHRDLKPENVFLVSRDDEERVKLLDFGIAKILGPGRVAEITQPVGTLQYMAPEVLRSRRLDCRADLWSLAVVLYRAVVGVLPFDAENLGDLVLKVCNDPVPRPSSVVPSLGGEIDTFFARALRRDPDERFQDADELTRAFSEAARVSWRPPPSTPPPELEVMPSFPPSLCAMDVTAERFATMRSPYGCP
jgi:serine/threonine-protein kinase